MFRSAYPLCFVLAAALASCSLRTDETAKNSRSTPAPSVAATAAPAQTPEATPEETAGRSATLLCHATETGDYEVYKKQTFAIDFEPFRNSCFVTAINPEYDDPPMESRFAIYRNGKKVFDFPSQFNGINFGCWVDAVSFQDLDADGLKDIIVISKCQAKVGDFNENTVYMNNGKGFTTREDANTQLGELTSIKQVVDFVKENPSMFF